MTDAFSLLLSAVRGGRAPHTTLISAPDTEEARLRGRAMAAALLECGEAELDSHPDYMEFARSAVKVNDIRDYLAAELGRRPFRGGARAVHFPCVHGLSAQNQNILLQVLEEPPAGTYFILSGNEAGVLPTVRSRAATVRLPAISQADIARRLGGPADIAARAAAASEGVFTRAETLAADIDGRMAVLTGFARFLTESPTIAAADGLPRERAAAKDTADDMLLFMADALTLKTGGGLLRFPQLEPWARRTANSFTRAQINCIIDMLAAHRARLDTNAGAGQAVDSLTARILEEIWSK